MYRPGTVIGDYRIEGELGFGGMGIVYEATQLSLDRRVALKVISGPQARDPTFRARFHREGLAQAGLNHPHVVPVIEAGEEDGVPFLAMQLIRGGTLRDVLADGGLEPARALRLLGPLADALDTAHEEGLIHRDIKPRNVLVSRRDHAYLADFGLTKAISDRGLTRTGGMVGTPDYTAPEHVEGEEMTAASDRYSFAAVLFECLAGRVPFDKPSEAAVLRAHIAEPPPMLSSVRPGLPAELDDVLARGLAKDPADRPATATELVEEVARALGSSSPDLAAEPRAGFNPPRAPRSRGRRERTTADRPPSRERRARPGPEGGGSRGRARRRVPAAAIGAGLVVAAIAAGLLAGSGSGEGDAGQRVSGRNVELTLPSAWKTSPAGESAAAALPGAAPQVVAVAGTDETLAAAVVEDPGSDLLPDPLVREVAARSALPAPQVVRIGGMDAYRYEPAAGYSAVAVPVETGAVVVVCRGEGDAFLADCGRAFSTLRLRGLKPRPFAADRENVAQVGRIVERLNQDRSAALADLGQAKTAPRQAQAANAGARAYDDAAKRLSRLRPGPVVAQEIATLRASARLARDAFRRLAGAAGRGDRAGYDRARRGVAPVEEDVQRRIERVRQAYAPAAGAAA
jgi:serine/threonine-protein kinase